MSPILERMKYVDTHNHQAGWSVDATVTLAELTAEARALGLAGLTLTDHYDYNGREDNVWYFDPESYAGHMADRRQTGSGDVLVLSGIELGYTREHEAHVRRIAALDGFDHVILSLHFFQGHDPFFEPDAVAAGYPNHAAFVAAVINEIAAYAERMPEVNTIGHYDFCSRYVRWDKSKFNYADAPEAFDRLLTAIIRNGQSLELNAGTVTSLLGKGYDATGALPDPAILSRYHELGGRLVTIASDAHKPGRLGQHAAALLAMLPQAGLSACYFREKKVCGV